MQLQRDSNSMYNRSEEESLDIRNFLYRILEYWKLVIAGVLIGLIGAWLYIRYSVPTYKGKTIILLADGEKSAPAMDMLLLSMGYYNPRLKFENEVLILKSVNLAERVLKKVPFEVSLIGEGRVRNVELYGTEKPFEIEYDPAHPQWLGEYEVTILSQNEFRIRIRDAKSAASYLYESDSALSCSSIKELEQIVSFNEWIESECYKFRLIPLKKLTEKANFTFKFQNRKGLANAYAQQVKIEPAAKSSSGINIELTGSSTEKIRDYLNAFVQSYIEFGLELKKSASRATLDFINEQLKGIEDSLIVAENILQTYRSSNLVIDIQSEAGELLSRLTEIDRESSQNQLKL
jgi:uncharacterized protein involved in exopolysaccharide biosynthesis